MASASTPPIWRAVFDAVERPVTRASESWVQTNSFMDGLALAWKVQRRVDREVRRGLELWFGALSLATRGDVDRLSGEIARVERELRELREQLERPTVPMRSASRPKSNGRAGTPQRGRRR